MEALEGCTDCGACCYSESARHAQVTGDDYARLGDDADRLVTWIGNEAFMLLDREREGGEDDEAGGVVARPRHCAALILRGPAGAFACSVYERRPQICRDLLRGSGACLGERATKGDRPKRGLMLLGRDAAMGMVRGLAGSAR